MPSNAKLAGPVMYTLLSSAHSISKSPPSSLTLTCLSERSFKTDATQEAEAPVPHAVEKVAGDQQKAVLSLVGQGEIQGVHHHKKDHELDAVEKHCAPSL